jgi:hypothetical protein
MDYEALRVIRNILLRTFAIGLFITLVLGPVTVLGWTTWIGIAKNWLHTDADTFSLLVLQFFSAIRFYLVFIVLTPALAIHWTIKKHEKES